MSASASGEHPTDALELLRRLPAVDQLAASLRDNGADKPTLAEATATARAVLAERRAELLGGDRDQVDLRARGRARLASRLRRVLNGTGVIVHTNLGRAPLADAAVKAVADSARGYLNIEMDLASGRRASRDAHVSSLLCELTGAEDGLAVNNGAGALLLAAATLGGPGRSIVVSRGQLVEIGGGFRIPDVVAQAGSTLVEVGTTNRTSIEDYQAAVADRATAAAVADGATAAAVADGATAAAVADGATAAAVADGATLILRVHQSNFRTLGFVSEPSIEQLCTLGPPVVDDVGSGVLARGVAFVDSEPSVRRSVRAGAALVCFSGDKLLGAPQAGILVGFRAAVQACRKHPLMRALRIGRLPLAGLAATLAIYRDPERALREIPVLSMLTTDASVTRRRAETLAAETGGEVIDAIARVGGGALPLLELDGPVVALDPRHDPVRLSETLRLGDPPVIPRIGNHRVLIDPRTLLDDEIGLAGAAVRRALRRAEDL
jgi:L-seryl-tRNA(Ser) seleniumtransferase